LGGTLISCGMPASAAAWFHVAWLNWKPPIYVPPGETAE